MLVNAFNGRDGPIYSAILAICVVAAGVLLVSLFARVTLWVKIPTLLSLIGGATIMLAAPNFGANQQALLGLIVAVVGVLAIRSA